MIDYWSARLSGVRNGPAPAVRLIRMASPGEGGKHLVFQADRTVNNIALYSRPQEVTPDFVNAGDTRGKSGVAHDRCGTNRDSACHVTSAAAWKVRIQPTSPRDD